MVAVTVVCLCCRFLDLFSSITWFVGSLSFFFLFNSHLCLDLDLYYYCFLKKNYSLFLNYDYLA